MSGKEFDINVHRDLLAANDLTFHFGPKDRLSLCKIILRKRKFRKGDSNAKKEAPILD